MNEYEAKREAFTTALDQLEKARARIKAINLALPDILENDQRQALREERARLTSEIETAPDEIGELARLVALADLARIKAETEEARAALAKKQAELAPIESEFMDFMKSKDQANRDNPYFRPGPDGTIARATAQASVAADLESRANPLSMAISRLDVKIKAFESRVMNQYPGADSSNPNTWARSAHLYGESCRKRAIG